MNQITKQRKKRKKRKSPFSHLPKGFLAIGVVFIIALALLYLHSFNVRLNTDVRNLTDQLNEIKAEIDSKNGQLMSNADLKAVETQARALGMTEAKPEQYIYESAARKQTVLADSPVGLYEYLIFFQQVRNEHLWPQEQ